MMPMDVSTELLCELLYATLDGNLCDFDPQLEKLVSSTSTPLYRGLKFPKTSLVPGGVLEQWGSCTHWTEDRNIARKFAKLGCSETEQCVPVVFVLPRGARDVIPTCKLLSKLYASGCVDELPYTALGYDDLDAMWSAILGEREHTIVDSDFVIDSVEELDGVSVAKVSQIPQM